MRGLLGVEEVPSRFEEVKGTIEVDCEASEERIKELGEKAEKYCPISDLYKAAGVKLELKWVKKV